MVWLQTDSNQLTPGKIRFIIIICTEAECTEIYLFSILKTFPTYRAQNKMERTAL